MDQKFYKYNEVMEKFSKYFREEDIFDTLENKVDIQTLNELDRRMAK